MSTIKQAAKECTAAVLITASIAGTLFCIEQATIAVAHADVVSGCQDDLWMTLQQTRRDICDGVIRPDGSWERARVFYTPAHQVPLTCTTLGSGFSVTTNCFGGYYQPETNSAVERYIVFPYNVLPDEPGHLVNDQQDNV